MQYWPNNVGETDIFGTFQVETLPDERVLPDYIVRKFKLSPANNVSIEKHL